MSKILDRVNSPEDIKALSPAELEILAEEIRKELVEVTTTNGGHLASSLGAVELTLALHRVFESPTDKIIWDVGHQAYAHKLITGRRELFKTMRTYKGLSGFPDRQESPHDHFGTGHASTSISAALGMAKARDLAGLDYNVIAVIGDGSIGGGMALEAINNAGQLNSRLIVILNDNGMSISPSVGSIARLLDRVRFTHKYDRAMAHSQQLIESAPFSNFWWKIARRLKSAAKGLVLPTRLWDEFGFTYMGPVNGHSIPEVEKALEYAKGYGRKPVLLHVVTTKGKGYGPAEDDSVCFHGISPAGPKKAIPSFSRVFADTCLELMEKDPSIVVITAAMPDGNSLSGIQERFPSRVFDVGICEQHAVTFAAGLATQGYKPVVAIYSTFLQRAFDQVIHDVCLQNLPVTFAVDRAGIVGEDGKTHQGTMDLSYLNCIPNMAVSAPMDENELRGLIYTAVYSGRPMAVRYPRGCGYGVELDSQLEMLAIGQAPEIRHGNDLTIIATGSTVIPSLDAAQILSLESIEARVINCRFVKPLDARMLEKAATETGNILIAEENMLNGGLASTISLALHKMNMDVRVDAVGIDDRFIEHGPQKIIRHNYGLDSEAIADKARTLLLGRTGREAVAPSHPQQ